jgi:hypothetical protein
MNPIPTMPMRTIADASGGPVRTTVVIDHPAGGSKWLRGGGRGEPGVGLRVFRRPTSQRILRRHAADG